MLGKILSTVLGGGLTKAIDTLGKQYTRTIEIREKAKNNSERIEAEKLLAQIGSREAVLIAEQSNWVTRWIRPAIALPIVTLIWFEVIMYILGLETKGWPDHLFWLVTTVVNAFFLGRVVEKWRRK